MFDFKLLIILIIGICLIKLFEYDEITTRSRKVLYLLFPLALIIILLYDNYHQYFLTPMAKEIIKWLALFAFLFSFYVYFITRSDKYFHHVYDTSVYIIWALLIVFALIFIYDNEMLVKLGIFKMILYAGLAISLL